MSKKEARKKMIGRLSDLDESYKQQQEDILKSELLDYIKGNDFKSVGIVLSMPHEMDTDKIILSLLDDGIEVYNPVCDYDEKVMNFHPFTTMEEVTLDEKGIRIPPVTAPYNDFDLVVVPGLVFDEEGYRIGYGGGFYDRFLAKEPEHPTLALCYAFQMLPKLETEEFDIPVDCVLWA